VASAFGFAYYVVNKEEVFSRRVLDYFVEAYRRGSTPNPCVRCNADVKFAALTELARSLGAEAVATGHYARLRDDAATGRRHLLRAVDEAKDQSYFLFDLTQAQLLMASFPLGGMTKRQVRDEAERLGLPVAGKAESQDVCFVEGGDYRPFVRRRLEAAGRQEPAGAIVDTGGRRLGKHAGLSAYTVGQRRGLGLSSSRRLYVVRVEPESNQVVLGGQEELACDRLALAGTRYIPFERPGAPFETSVRFRYRHAGAPARVIPESEDRATVVFLEPQRGVSPGQAAVFYDEEAVIGGGWIESVSRADRLPLAPGSAAAPPA